MLQGGSVYLMDKVMFNVYLVRAIFSFVYQNAYTAPTFTLAILRGKLLDGSKTVGVGTALA